MEGRPQVESPKLQQQQQQQQPSPLGQQVAQAPGFGRGSPGAGMFDGPSSKRCRF